MGYLAKSSRRTAVPKCRRRCCRLNVTDVSVVVPNVVAVVVAVAVAVNVAGVVVVAAFGVGMTSNWRRKTCCQNQRCASKVKIC